jgi:hypothetical protein
MHANERAGDARPELELIRRDGNPAYEIPDECAVPLPIDPRMKVVGDEREGESRLLRSPCVIDERERWVLLGRE